MIAPVQTAEQTRTASKLQERFLVMLPLIRHQACLAFRELTSEAREEAIAEVVANTFSAFARLVSRGKDAYSTPLAQYAIRQIRQGRRVGTRLNRRDVMTGHAQRLGGMSIKRLDHFDDQHRAWKEMLIEDRKAGPAEIAAARIDVAAWLRSLSGRNRRIAETLAMGATAGDVASEFHLSCSRVSQIRNLLAASWESFHGDTRSHAARRADAS